MNSIADELIHNSEAITQRWYESWRSSAHSHQHVLEAALKDGLALQLRTTGEELRDGRGALYPREMRHGTKRFHPEEPVESDVPIEEVVHEYWLAVRTVREWMCEKHIDVDTQECAYFYETMYEWLADTVRRYAAYQAEQVRSDRAHYLASVMHQLRTPLSTLSLQVELLGESGKQADSTVICGLRRNIRRIKVLVEGILRLERFQPSEVAVRPQEVQLERLVNDIMNDYQTEATRAGLRFEAHVDRSLSIITDPDLFIDALGNLIQNAVKYASKGFVIVDSACDSQDIVFHVRDSGPGIAAEKQRTLFKDTQPGSAGGAGIGLQIAQHAAQAQGGFIRVESDPGKGSIFSLRIPRDITQRFSRSGVQR